jgi:TRAP-type mannitol/chloroaromatic compound transport system substrate-binding protein
VTSEIQGGFSAIVLFHNNRGDFMERRSFIRRAGTGMAAAAVAAPALGQTGQPEIRWRMASSFPKSLDTLFGTADHFAKRVSDATGGKFQIRHFAGGEIVPPLQVLDAVQQGTVEAGHTVGYYYVGKNSAWALDTCLPFGLNARQMNAWLYFGGGKELLRDFYREYGVVGFPMGSTGVQMGGWFRKELRGLGDVKGLKFRIPGFGARVWAALGAVPQALAAAEVYQALERGTIDATEFVGPYDDEKLGFYKIAKFYYYPAFWEPGPMVSLYINQKAWDGLPAEYKAIVEAAAGESNVMLTASYDAKNPAALQRLVNQGVQLRAFPPALMQAAYTAAQDIYADERAKNPTFAKIFDSWDKFRADQQRWFRVAELSMESFRPQTTAPAKGTSKK